MTRLPVPVDVAADRADQTAPVAEHVRVRERRVVKCVADLLCVVGRHATHRLPGAVAQVEHCLAVGGGEGGLERQVIVAAGVGVHGRLVSL